MPSVLLSLLLQAAAATGAPFNPNANALFERDSELKAWAVRLYDGNRDGWLTLYEAQEAALAFKRLADSDRDGRVSVNEFGNAREFVRVRW